MEVSKGCGIHINPNGSDLRCGNKDFSPLHGYSKVILCNRCQMARQLDLYQDTVRRLTSKGTVNG